MVWGKCGPGKVCKPRRSRGCLSHSAAGFSKHSCLKILFNPTQLEGRQSTGYAGQKLYYQIYPSRCDLEPKPISLTTKMNRAIIPVIRKRKWNNEYKVCNTARKLVKKGDCIAWMFTVSQICFVFFFFVFWVRISLCSWLFWNSLYRLDWLVTHRDPPASTSQVLGLKVCTTIRLYCSIFKKIVVWMC